MTVQHIIQILNLVLILIMLVTIPILIKMKIVRREILINLFIWLIHAMIFYVVVLSPLSVSDFHWWSSVLRLHLLVSMVMTFVPMVFANLGIIKAYIQDYKAKRKAEKLIERTNS